MKRPSFPRRVYDYLTQRWLLTGILLTITANWFVLLRFAGRALHLTAADGELTKLGNWTTWPLFGAALVFTFLKTAADRYNERAKTRGGFILQRLLEGVNDVVTKKMRRFCEYVEVNDHRPELAPFREITQPRQQIQSLLDNIRFTLAEIFDISREQIGISVLCSVPGVGGWRFLENVNVSDELDLPTLLSNPASTVWQVIEGRESFLFFPDKRVGAERQQYVPGPRDRRFGGIGSILCREISVGSERKYLRAVLSITTYGKMLCRADDADAIHKIENIIVPPFESRLRLELALYYIKEVRSPRCLRCADQLELELKQSQP